MAEERNGASKAGTAVLPMADGGPADRAAKSNPKGQEKGLVLTAKVKKSCTIHRIYGIISTVKAVNCFVSEECETKQKSAGAGGSFEAERGNRQT